MSWLAQLAPQPMRSNFNYPSLNRRWHFPSASIFPLAIRFQILKGPNRYHYRLFFYPKRIVSFKSKFSLHLVLMNHLDLLFLKTIWEFFANITHINCSPIYSLFFVIFIL
jgi:hypothetical protein